MQQRTLRGVSLVIADVAKVVVVFTVRTGDIALHTATNILSQPMS
jgi:hypothetical protein